MQTQPAVGRARVRVQRCLLVARALGLEGEVRPDMSQAQGTGVEKHGLLDLLGPRTAAEATLVVGKSATRRRIVLLCQFSAW